MTSSEKFLRHLVECHCILKLFQNKSKPLYHKFPVFSLIDEEGNIEQKYVSCNNCGAIHEIVDACKSDIKWGGDMYTGLVVTKDDIIFNLQNNGKEKVIEILEKNNCDLSIWEMVDFCIENNIDHTVILDKQEIQDNIVYNCLNIVSGNIKIKKEISQRYV